MRGGKSRLDCLGKCLSCTRFCLLESATSVGLVDKTVLLFDLFDGGYPGLELGITIDVWEDVNLGVGASAGEERRKFVRIGGSPVEGRGERREALDLRGVVFRVEHPFDGCCMRVSE